MSIPMNKKERIKLDKFKKKAIEIFIDYHKNEYNKKYKPDDMDILYAYSNILYEQALMMIYEQGYHTIYQLFHSIGTGKCVITTLKNPQFKTVDFIED